MVIFHGHLAVTAPWAGEKREGREISQKQYYLIDTQTAHKANQIYNLDFIIYVYKNYIIKVKPSCPREAQVIQR